ncbi:glycosyltransferase [Effusibacillus lacus]|uniref:Colanic acid biosynthesis glycosyltransferase WcaL n=1 Tax=Effusibacillus lacus TaxID=1348429 RepID=A0A292YU26_9BACL|nr:glycosyltransferase [Effusibacillus lacus]TCS73503.1 glycosyltransferase involved in cell wall biosynthesis [Effusibacillus lacus]GAX92000.1 colanic acid biosynthesis glycosyltransferase WcaL [Effusibacillus lacus]
MSRIAVIRSWYLPSSETFIYSELINLSKVAPIVCTKKVMNLERFPFHSIYLFKKSNELEKVLKKRNIDLIHARFGTTAVELLDLKKKLGVPMLTSFHGFDLPSNKVSYKKYKGKLQQLFQEGEAFTVTSNNMKKILMDYGCPKNKIIVHYSGIDVDRFEFKERKIPENNKIRLLCVGRMVEKKGMKYLINAFHRVYKIYPNIRLHIAGDGPLRKKLKKQVKELKIEGKVKFLGEISHKEVVKEMHKAHIFVLASVTGKHGNQEGIPNVLKEAMATGMPVISTKHAGIPELVRDGKSGFLVDEKDSKKLAERILDLIRNPDLWIKMGKKGRDTVKRKFNSAKQVEELEKIYDILLKK